MCKWYHHWVLACCLTYVKDKVIKVMNEIIDYQDAKDTFYTFVPFE